MPFKTRQLGIQSFTKFALRRVVQKLPSRNERKMANMTAALAIFSNNAGSPTGSSGLSAFVGTLQHLLSPVRQQMEIDSSSEPRKSVFEIDSSVAHDNYFGAILRVAITVNAEAFEEANVSSTRGS